MSVINVRAPIIKAAKESVISKAFRLLLAQFTLSNAVIRQSNRVGVIMLYFSAGLLFLPVLCARILGKKVVIITTGSGSQSLHRMYPDLLGRLYSTIVRGIEHIDYSLADKIVVYSKSMIAAMGLEGYRSKISIAHKHFLDFDKFKIQKQLNERDSSVGYIGRLSEEKGILNFVKAIPAILKEKENLEFLIGGGGQLGDKIEKYLDEENLNNKVKLVGWIPHDKISDYLNELKLLVLPSYTEGLPNIMLEAMACGTPVLATPVGAIPDVIKEEQTGFIMENNSPECIAKNIIKALDYPKIEEISRNARALVEKEFTYEKAAERWREILLSLV